MILENREGSMHELAVECLIILFPQLKTACRMASGTVDPVDICDVIIANKHTGNGGQLGEEVSHTDCEQQGSQDQEVGALSYNWKPYESANKELPVTCFVPPIYYKIRWMWVQVFLKRVILDICVGEIIMFLLVFAVAAIPAGTSCCRKKRTGSAANIPLALTFVLASRNSVFTFIFGVPFERALKWHKWMSLFSVASGVYHGIVSKKADGSGIVLVSLMGALLISSFFPIRRWVFEIFLKLHWVLFIGVVIAAFIHDAGAIVFGVFVWVLDVICRCIVLWRNRQNSAKVMMTRLPADVIRLTFKKGTFRYMSGQYVFICIPKVSYFEWHPFSISSSPHNDDVHLHVRVLGDWTKQLYDKADSTETTAFIDGPYGQPSVDVDGDKYKIFVFVSGGIGITPMQSICNDLIHQSLRGRPLKKIFFIWSVRDAFMVTSVLDYDQQYFGHKVPQTLPYSFSPDMLSENLDEDVLDAQFYLTRARGAEDYASANIRPEMQSCLKFGRPNFEEIFNNIHKFAGSVHESKVAVLTCGPSGLVDDALKYSIQFSKDGVYFDFHSELFEF